MPGNGRHIATGTGRHVPEAATGRGGVIVTGTGKHSKVERKGAYKPTTRTADRCTSNRPIPVCSEA